MGGRQEQPLKLPSQFMYQLSTRFSTDTAGSVSDVTGLVSAPQASTAASPWNWGVECYWGHSPAHESQPRAVPQSTVRGAEGKTLQ